MSFKKLQRISQSFQDETRNTSGKSPVPSGKLTKSYGKSPFLMGKLTINHHFQVRKLLNYQRANGSQHMPCCNHTEICQMCRSQTISQTTSQTIFQWALSYSYGPTFRRGRPDLAVQSHRPTRAEPSRLSEAN